MGKIVAISISNRKGMRKNNISSANLITNFGLENDAHGGSDHRQVSLLAQESINFMREKGLDVVAGNFAENITSIDVDLLSLEVGQEIQIGESQLIISQLGKICHSPCAIFHQAGDCVMPREGIFGVVLSGGKITIDDPVTPRSQWFTTAACIGPSSKLADHKKQIHKIMKEKYNCVFTRFDLYGEKNDQITTILDDLVHTQKIQRIAIIDPSNQHTLALAGFERKENNQSEISYSKNKSTIEYWTSKEDFLSS